MRRDQIIANAILWAAAILAAAILDAPATLTAVLLPSLAAIALAISLRREPVPRCDPS